MYEIETLNDIKEVCNNRYNECEDGSEYYPSLICDDVEFHLEQYESKNKYTEECVETLPKRFRIEFIGMLEESPQTLHSIRKNYEMFLETILDELTEEEHNKIFKVIA